MHLRRQTPLKGISWRIDILGAILLTLLIACSSLGAEPPGGESQSGGAQPGGTPSGGAQPDGRAVPSSSLAKQGRGNVRAYQIRIVEIANPKSPELFATGTAETVAVVEGLEPGVNYTWRVVIPTGAGKLVSPSVRCKAPICPVDTRAEVLWDNIPVYRPLLSLTNEYYGHISISTYH